MKIQGLKLLSKEYIELKAEEVISSWCQEVLENPMALPLEKICTKLKVYGYRIELEAELLVIKNQKIFGCFSFEEKIIFIDKSLSNDQRFSFVLAHEIGHVILHRHVIFPKEEYDIFQETEKTIYGKRDLVTDYDFMEWQANKFAECILMPRQTVKRALIKTQLQMGIPIGRTGYIVVNHDKSSQSDYHLTILTLAGKYNVTKANMEIRLRELQLIKSNISTNGLSSIMSILKDKQ